jgi:hypothetical protein
MAFSAGCVASGQSAFCVSTRFRFRRESNKSKPREGRRGKPRVPRAAADDQNKVTNADAFKALERVNPGNKKTAASPFGETGVVAVIAGFASKEVDKKTLPTTIDADRLLGRFDKAQRLGSLADEKSAEGSPQCAYPPLRQSCRALASKSSRVMLGICAPSASAGIQTLKAWVTDLGLPRGKLHGLDVDGVEQPPPTGAVFVKYNSGTASGLSQILTHRVQPLFDVH